MPADDSKRLLINPIVYDWLKDLCPEFIPMTSFANWLLVEAMTEIENRPEDLTRVPRLGKPSTAERRRASSLPLGTSDLLSEEINYRVSDPNPPRAVDLSQLDAPDQRAEVLPSSNYYARKTPKKTEYTDAFNEFWRTYQTAPRKANGQKKPLAFEAWKDALVEASAEEMTKAITAAIAEQQQLIKKDQFCAPLPDCFRWLRDGNFAVHLEEHQQMEKPKVDPQAEAKEKERRWLERNIRPGETFEETVDRFRAAGSDVRYH